MTRKIAGLFLILSCSVINSPTEAALTVSLSPTSTQLPASGGTVTFTGSMIGDAGEMLEGYNFLFDIPGVDLSLPGPISISNFVPMGLVGASSMPIGQSDDRDISVQGSGFTLDEFFNAVLTPVSVAGGIDLFSFDATFAANNGDEVTYDFPFTTTLPGFQIGLTGVPAVDLNSVTFNNASVTIAAVPEPSSLAVLGGILIFGACRLCRSRAAVWTASRG